MFYILVRTKKDSVLTLPGCHAEFTDIRSIFAYGGLYRDYKYIVALETPDGYTKIKESYMDSLIPRCAPEIPLYTSNKIVVKEIKEFWDLDTIKQCLKLGAKDIDMLLIKAASKNSRQNIVRYLLKQYKNISEGVLLTAMSTAIELRQKDTLSVFDEMHYIKPHIGNILIRIACKDTDTTIARLLIKRGADVQSALQDTLAYPSDQFKKLADCV